MTAELLKTSGESNEKTLDTFVVNALALRELPLALFLGGVGNTEDEAPALAPWAPNDLMSRIAGSSITSTSLSSSSSLSSSTTGLDAEVPTSPAAEFEGIVLDRG
eukprot:CAMPEP_0185754618 /NCGR_PEP_ID=MMETSP1174-20130828/13240_1 /TAXON_ID=35687 /ORGANISM="Dictyocha speculum, Strain CCMP1381" /LENGTH=104 /DNA_ID=CAMNT_0028432901 /DNA_START=655 /DNA_END=970 /DNA_ORIENTATION=+